MVRPVYVHFDRLLPVAVCDERTESDYGKKNLQCPWPNVTWVKA